MASKGRARRVGERIREELAAILLEQVSDPRLKLMTITGVEVDRELAFATIYVTAMGEADRSEEVMQGLEAAQGFFRRELAGRIDMRSFPQLRFRWDASYEHGTRIDELLDQLRSERGEPTGEQGDEDR
jgi:ribosome-binding factor A